MTSDAIDAVARSIPGAVQPATLPEEWAGDMIPVEEDSDPGHEIDDWLTDVPAEEAPGRVAPPDDWSSVEGDPERIIEDGPPPLPGTYDDVIRTSDDLAGRLGSGFPGAPGPASGTGVGGVGGWCPPPDVLGFYLPWHDFPARLWGIYLIVQGITSLGRDLHYVARGYLTLGEAHRVARSFIFHHEAYHNVVETFAARLEVSHRCPCYRAGFRQVWRTGFNGNLHEEGMATAYAYEKVRGEAFENMPKGHVRTRKRGVAAAALRCVIGYMPPLYNSALQVLGTGWDGAEHDLQEALHSACGFGLPRLGRDIWQASGHAMHPSLGRNRRFSYLIDRNHPAIRQAAQVPHFARREVVRRLHLATGGREEGGGEHPKVVLPNGRRVPVPGHPELGRGLTRKILRDAGLTTSLSRFMAASDDDLRQMGRTA
jgi:predicted RNA binding protein YcfA (HicA-like mRNA interferase family)